MSKTENSPTTTPEQTVQQRIAEIDAALGVPDGSEESVRKTLQLAAEGREQAMTVSGNVSRVLATVQRTAEMLERLRADRQDEFPNKKTLWFVSDLEGLPFMVVSDFEFVNVPDNFNEEQTTEVVQCDIWLVDPHHPDEEPPTVQAQLQGAYLLNQLRKMTPREFRAYVWTVKRNPRMPEHKQYGFPRMLALWEPNDSTDTVPF